MSQPGSLKPCPFCGGPAKGESSFPDHKGPSCYICCPACDMSPDGCYRKAEEWLQAVECWNTRTPEAATTIARLVEENERLKALIGPESIERLAEDIAIACVDCRPEIREARHRAMVRLGERLRKPLTRDLAALSLTGEIDRG